MQCEFIADVGMLYPTPSSPKKYRYYMLECPYCGKRFENQARHYKKHGTKSCRECSSGIRDKSIYHRTHGKRGHPLYQVWSGMKSRCDNSNHVSYKNYGRRGISVCTEWGDFSTFYNWAVDAGYKKGLDIDRKNNDEGYSPANCRFVTREKNLLNQRPIRKNNTTGYTGVFRYGRTGRKYYAKIYLNGKPINLGVFDTKEEASGVYQKAKREKINYIF